MSEEINGEDEGSLRKTYELKLNLDMAQQVVLKNIISEYKKVQQFVADRAMQLILLKLKELPEGAIETGHCKKCFNPDKPKDKKLKWKWTNENLETELNCGCLLSHFSLRKIFLPSKNYKVHPDWDMRMAGRLYFGDMTLTAGTDNGEKYNRQLYDYCLKKTSETIRSQVGLNKKLDKLIEKDVAYITTLEKAKKTLIIPDELKERGIISEKSLDKAIIKQRTKIEKLEARRASDINFHTLTVRLPPTYCFVDKIDGQYKLIFKNIHKEPLTVDFFGKERTDIDINALFNQDVVPELDLTYKRGDFYIQYIYRVPAKNAAPSKDMTPVGISFGLKNAACAVSAGTAKTKVQFWNGRPMLRQARQFYKINHIWQKRKDTPQFEGDELIRTKKQKKWYKARINAFSLLRYTNSETHKLSRSIVDYIKANFENPVICLQDLKDIEFYIKRSKVPFHKLDSKGKRIYQKQKFKNWMLKKWNYRMLASQIEYKARWDGIPVVYLKAYGDCPKCGKRNFKGFFNLVYKCEDSPIYAKKKLKKGETPKITGTQKGCGYTANERFVAASAIAKKYKDAEIKEFKGKWVEWHEKKEKAVE